MTGVSNPSADSDLEVVAFFLPTLTPGGIERAMLNLAAGFLNTEIDVDIVTASGHGDFVSEIPQETRHVDLNSKRTLTSSVPLSRYLRNRKPDVLISGHTHANIVAVGAGLVSPGDTKVVVSAQKPHSMSFQKSESTKSRIINRLFPVAYRHADKVVAISNGVAKDLIENAGIASDHVSTIYNPVVGEGVSEMAKIHTSHRWLHDERLDVVMSAGRLSPVKDYETLIRAFKDVVDMRPTSRLLLAGSGPEKESLQRLIRERDLSDRIDLLGHVDNPYAYMRLADVFVLTSKWEGLGNVLVEAMAVGTPVVSTDCPTGPREILEDGKYGLLVSVGDESAIANAICTSIDNPTDSHRLKQRAQDFSVESITKEYRRLLRSI